MSKIKIMSESLANKIAAGEVVEKCASVVKELVENSIDAHATNIKIDLKNGGLSEIKITDNGIGMNHEDALLSFQRHATSKLTKEDDLFFINTLGFRGEALPSIAAVSEVDLVTCDQEIGTHIHLKGGKLTNDEPSNSRIGTIISVTNLFYNTPARLKYLKSEQYELVNSVSFIEKLSLSYPQIQFELTNNEKTLVKTSGSNNLLKTIHEIYGLSVSSNMIEIKASNEDYDIYGYICKPEILKSNRNHLITIVNGRIVRNNDLNRAINDAYFRYKPDTKYPVVVLKIETDPTLIDVNIHPTKQDIKLSKASELYTLITNTIKGKLEENLLIPNVLKEEQDSISLPKTMLEDTKKEEPKEKSKEETISLQFDLDNNIQNEEVKIKVSEERPVYKSIKDRALNPEIKDLNLEVVGQVLGTYIVCQNPTGMYLIDQHAAEERINYEKVEDEFKSRNISTIDSLIPLNIELTNSDYLKIKEHLDILTNLGFKVEDFGINTLSIKSHPTWLKEGHEEETIKSIIDEIITIGNNFEPIRFNNKLIATIACKMSVKANTRLTKEEMTQIVNELVKCRNPYNCAHGRPSIVKYSTYDLEKMFKRVMN